MPKYIIKHTKKWSGNEILNNINKTQKYNTINNNYNYNYNYNKKLKNKQRGGNGIFGQTEDTTTTLFGSVINKEDINYDRFDVGTKQEYNILKKDVKVTQMSAYIAKKSGKLTEEQYTLQMHLLLANLYFAKMKLYQAQLVKISNLLVGNNNSIIFKIHKYINDIFSLQHKLSTGYNISSVTSGITAKPNNKNIIKIIKQQDKCRFAILKLISFKNTDDLNSGCSDTGGANILNKNKEFICILSKYRVYESKFNNYGNKFKNELQNFYASYPNCDTAINKINLGQISILTKQNIISHEPLAAQPTDANAKGKGQTQYKHHDPDAAAKMIGGAAGVNPSQNPGSTKGVCNIAELYKLTDSTMKEILKSSSSQLSSEYTDKTLGDKTVLSKDYMNTAKSFEKTIKMFNTKLDKFNTFFNTMEYYGVRHYANLLPLKTQFFSGLKNKDTLNFVDASKMQDISNDKIFITEFKKLLNNLYEKGAEIFIPISKSENSIIPRILIKKTITLPSATPATPPATPPATTPATPVKPPAIPPATQATTTHNITDIFSIMNINIDYVKLYNNKSFRELYVNNNDDSNNIIFYFPIVICINNGSNDMINKNSNFCTSFLENKYVPISFSKH